MDNLINPEIRDLQSKESRASKASTKRSKESPAILPDRPSGSS